MKKILFVVLPFVFFLSLFLYSCETDLPVTSNVDNELKGLGTATYAFHVRIRIYVDSPSDSLLNHFDNYSSNYTSGDFSPDTVYFTVPTYGGGSKPIRVKITESVAWAMPGHEGTTFAQSRFKIWLPPNDVNILVNGDDTLNIPNMEHDSRGYTSKVFYYYLNRGQTYAVTTSRGTREYSPSFRLNMNTDMMIDGNTIPSVFLQQVYSNNPLPYTSDWYSFHTGKKLSSGKSTVSFISTVLSGHTIFAVPGYKSVIEIKLPDNSISSFDFPLFDSCTLGTSCPHYINSDTLCYRTNSVTRMMHPVYCKCDTESLCTEYPGYKFSDLTNPPFPSFTFLEESQYFIRFKFVSL